LVNAQADALGDTKPRFKAQGGSMSTVNSEVVSEIYKAMEKLGAGSDLLGIVGSWGDSLPEPQVLSMLRSWNERVPAYEKNPPHSIICTVPPDGEGVPFGLRVGDV
jgi:hypothetical protein